MAPLLAVLLASGCGPPSPDTLLAPAPDAAFQVRAFSEERGAWRARPEPVAHSFSTLHAAVVDDELVVTGLAALGEPSWWASRFPRLFVDALVTADLERWHARRWRIDAPGRSVIDPAIVPGPDGPELWFVQADGLGDPAKGGRRTDLVRARLDGDRFRYVETWATGTGLVDVAPAWYRGAWHVFATRDHREVVRVRPDGRVETVIRDASVPFAEADGDTLRVLAQRMRDGRMLPLAVETEDGATWTPPAFLPLEVPPGLRTCASPVRATLGAQKVLVCVDERRSPG